MFTSNVTVNKAVAMKVHNDRLGFYGSGHIPTGGAEVMLNGNPVATMAPGDTTGEAVGGNGPGN